MHKGTYAHYVFSAIPMISRVTFAAKTWTLIEVI